MLPTSVGIAVLVGLIAILCLCVFIVGRPLSPEEARLTMPPVPGVV